MAKSPLSLLLKGSTIEILVKQVLQGFGQGQFADTGMPAIMPLEIIITETQTVARLQFSILPSLRHTTRNNDTVSASC